MRKSRGMFKLYLVKKKIIYDSLIFGLFPEDENSTRQTGRIHVTSAHLTLKMTSETERQSPPTVFSQYSFHVDDQIPSIYVTGVQTIFYSTLYFQQTLNSQSHVLKKL